jgi:hypothetical protein
MSAELFGSRKQAAKVMVLFVRRGIWTSLVFSLALALQASVDPIITKYKAAACVALSSSPADPHTRRWKATLSLGDGSQVVVSGACMAGGMVVAFYPLTGQEYVAANAGDYVYPSDIRFDSQNDLLYVKAAGLAGGIWERTILFEYDLRQHRLLNRRGVKANALPEECSGVEGRVRSGR